MKKLLALIAASIATSLFLYALVSKDQPTRHPGLKTTGLAPLIALHDFYGTAHDKQDRKTSGTGTSISWEQTTDTTREPTSQLTFPETSSDPGPLPTVILVNAGREAGTGPDAERTIRFLANRGYVVLSIDCGGFTEIDETAIEIAPRFSIGCTETGIVDSARALIDQGIADPAALAIIGSGVGGYLALMTMSLEPGLFKAAMVHSLVNGQAYQSSANAIRSKPRQVAVNPIETVPYTTSIVDRSPAARASHVQAAVLMSHGKADTVAASDQAKAFAQGMSDAGMDIEFVAFNHEDHCYSRWQTRVQVARLTERFLARHLGGRDGGYDYIELLAKVF